MQSMCHRWSGPGFQCDVIDLLMDLSVIEYFMDKLLRIAKPNEMNIKGAILNYEETVDKL